LCRPALGIPVFDSSAQKVLDVEDMEHPRPNANASQKPLSRYDLNEVVK
jgi:hypothetical protein